MLAERPDGIIRLVGNHGGPESRPAQRRKQLRDPRIRLREVRTVAGIVSGEIPVDPFGCGIGRPRRDAPLDELPDPVSHILTDLVQRPERKTAARKRVVDALMKIRQRI